MACRMGTPLQNVANAVARQSHAIAMPTPRHGESILQLCVSFMPISTSTWHLRSVARSFATQTAMERLSTDTDGHPAIRREVGAQARKSAILTTAASTSGPPPSGPLDRFTVRERMERLCDQGAWHDMQQLLITHLVAMQAQQAGARPGMAARMRSTSKSPGAFVPSFTPLFMSGPELSTLERALVRLTAHRELLHAAASKEAQEVAVAFRRYELAIDVVQTLRDEHGMVMPAAVFQTLALAAHALTTVEAAVGMKNRASEYVRKLTWLVKEQSAAITAYNNDMYHLVKSGNADPSLALLDRVSPFTLQPITPPFLMSVHHASALIPAQFLQRSQTLAMLLRAACACPSRQRAEESCKLVLSLFQKHSVSLQPLHITEVMHLAARLGSPHDVWALHTATVGVLDAFQASGGSHSRKIGPAVGFVPLATFGNASAAQPEHRFTRAALECNMIVPEPEVDKATGRQSSRTVSLEYHERTLRALVDSVLMHGRGSLDAALRSALQHSPSSNRTEAEIVREQQTYLNTVCTTVRDHSQSLLAHMLQCEYTASESILQSLYHLSSAHATIFQARVGPPADSPGATKGAKTAQSTLRGVKQGDAVLSGSSGGRPPASLWSTAGAVFGADILVAVCGTLKVPLEPQLIAAVLRTEMRAGRSAIARDIALCILREAETFGRRVEDAARQGAKGSEAGAISENRAAASKLHSAPAELLQLVTQAVKFVETEHPPAALDAAPEELVALSGWPLLIRLPVMRDQALQRALLGALAGDAHHDVFTALARDVVACHSLPAGSEVPPSDAGSSSSLPPARARTAEAMDVRTLNILINGLWTNPSWLAALLKRLFSPADVHAQSTSSAFVLPQVDGVTFRKIVQFIALDGRRNSFRRPPVLGTGAHALDRCLEHAVALRVIQNALGRALESVITSSGADASVAEMQRQDLRALRKAYYGHWKTSEAGRVRPVPLYPHASAWSSEDVRAFALLCLAERLDRLRLCRLSWLATVQDAQPLLALLFRPDGTCRPSWRRAVRRGALYLSQFPEVMLAMATVPAYVQHAILAVPAVTEGEGGRGRASVAGSLQRMLDTDRLVLQSVATERYLAVIRSREQARSSAISWQAFDSSNPSPALPNGLPNPPLQHMLQAEMEKLGAPLPRRAKIVSLSGMARPRMLGATLTHYVQDRERLLFAPILRSFVRLHRAVQKAAVAESQVDREAAVHSAAARSHTGASAWAEMGRGSDHGSSDHSPATSRGLPLESTLLYEVLAPAAVRWAAAYSSDGSGPGRQLDHSKA